MSLTLKDVATHAGVSPATVSKVLNNARHVRKATRERVLQAIAELDYRPSLYASTLRNKRSQTIGIISERPIVYEYIAHALTGILNQITAEGLSALVSEVSDRTGSLRDCLNQFQRRHVDGIIFIGSGFTPSPSLDLPDWNPPRVYLFSQPESTDGSVLLVDDTHGATLGTQHLLDLGHRRIAFIGGPERSQTARNRLQGYLQTLENSGRSPDPRLIRTGSWSEEHGFAAVFDLVATHEEFTAIFAANDFIAAGALHAVQSLGRHVPGDIALLGFDDHTIASMLRPRLTTIAMPGRDMGKEAVRLLMEQILVPHGNWTYQMLPCRLVVRESTAKV